MRVLVHTCLYAHAHTHARTRTHTHTHTWMHAHITDGMRAVQNLEPHRLYRPLGMLCTCILSLPEMCRMHLSSTCVCLHMLRVRCVCVRVQDIARNVSCACSMSAARRMPAVEIRTARTRARAHTHALNTQVCRICKATGIVQGALPLMVNAVVEPRVGISNARARTHTHTHTLNIYTHARTHTHTST